MTWTRWHSPSQARQLESHEIAVNSQSARGQRNFVSVDPVRSISTSFGTFIREESTALLFTDFGLPALSPQGIQVRLIAQRVARIQDKTVQLWNGRETVGENRADLSAGNDTVYGDQDDLWGLRKDSLPEFASSDFGVVIDLQPHTEIPCSDTVLIRSVRVRVWSQD